MPTDQSFPAWPPALSAVVNQLRAEVEEVYRAQLGVALDAVGGVDLTEDDELLLTVGRETGIAAAFLVLERRGWLKAPGS